jgi:hypothetical protein
MSASGPSRNCTFSWPLPRDWFRLEAGPRPKLEATLAHGSSCENLGDPPELFFTLFGLWAVYFVRGEFRTALMYGGSAPSTSGAREQ